MVSKFLIFLTFVTFSLQGQNFAQLHLISAMIDSIKNDLSIRFKVTAIERTNGTYVKAISECKVQTAPRCMYLHNREKKLEILYSTGHYTNKAVVKPHVFPYLTLQLNPNGNLMRKNQHYTINELGFDFIGKSVAMALSKEKENFTRCITYYGKVEKNGNMCYLLVYEAKSFPYNEYIVKEKETVSSIALKFNCNDFLLRTKNDLYNDFDYLKAGSKIQVPQFYCKKAVFYVDEKTMLPVSVAIFDEVGLFESYDFTNIIVNKPISAEEFTKDYKDYHF